MDNKKIVFVGLMVLSSMVMVGAINMTIIWELIDEIVTHMDDVVNLVIVGVVIGVAVAIGAFIKSALNKGLKQ